MTNPNQITANHVAVQPPTMGNLMGELLHKANQAGIFSNGDDTYEDQKRIMKAIDKLHESFITGMLTRSKVAEREAFEALQELIPSVIVDSAQSVVHLYASRATENVSQFSTAQEQAIANIVKATITAELLGGTPEAAFDTVANAVDGSGNGGLTIENWHKQDAMKLAVPIVTQFVNDTYGMKPNTEGQHEVPINVEREELIAAVRILADAKGGFFHGYDGYTVTGLRPMESDEGMMIATFQVRKFKN